MNMDRQTCLNTLRDSITFQMSLGSKELFHTNFLQWLSIVDWDRFLNLLHFLTGEKEFWWENIVFYVEASHNKGQEKIHPNNGNIEVRREHNNYDLSIYILVGYSKPRNEGEARKKWRPVFILENKVKSMPYQEQLNGYAQKAYDEWEGSHPKGQAKDWATEGITFVLLSLFDEVLFNHSRIQTENNKNIDIKWHLCNYHKLHEAISANFSNVPQSKAKAIIEDYCTFVEALHNLSQTEDWKVDHGDKYYEKIIKPAQEEVQLRISDIREKIHHERMLHILIKKLQTSTILKGRCEHWNKEKEFKDPKGKKHYNTGIVFYETAFSRGSGATQVFIIINDVYRLMIQLQGNQYRRCVILHPIKKNKGKKMERICDGISKIIWNGFKPSCQYGDLFKYDYELIPNWTIEDVLNKLVGDIEKIIDNLDVLKNLK